MGMGALCRTGLARDAARGVVEMSMMEDGRTDRDPPGAGADPHIINCEAGLSPDICGLILLASDLLTRNRETGSSGPPAAACDTHWWQSFLLDLGRARTTAPCNSLRVGPQNMLYLPAAGTQWAMYVQILGHTESCSAIGSRTPPSPFTHHGPGSFLLYW